MAIFNSYVGLPEGIYITYAFAYVYVCIDSHPESPQKMGRSARSYVNNDRLLFHFFVVHYVCIYICIIYILCVYNIYIYVHNIIKMDEWLKKKS